MERKSSKGSSLMNDNMEVNYWGKPFIMTEAKNLVHHLEQEIFFKQKVQKNRLKLPVSKKVTVASKLHAYPTSVRSLQALTDAEEQLALVSTIDKTPGHIPPEHIIKVTSDIQHAAGKSISDYICKCRRILLIEQALQIKHEEVLRMKKVADEAEKQFEKEELKLEEDALRLSEFIHDSDVSLLDLKERLVTETTVKEKKLEDVRYIFSNLFITKNEIATGERLLGNYMQCSNFLESLIPQKFEEEPILKTSDLKEPNEKQKDAERSSTSYVDSICEYMAISSTIQDLIENTDVSKDLEPLEIPFGSPMELLKMMEDLKQQNLSLLKHRFYTREALMEATQNFQKGKNELEKELSFFENEISSLSVVITGVNYKAKSLKKATALVASRSVSEEEEEIVEKLEAKISSTYSSCVGSSSENMNTFAMLVEIEKVLVSLLKEIANLPKKKLDKVHRVKQIQRKVKERKEEAEERIRYFEERMHRKVERAAASSANKLRRRLMYRSQPFTKEISQREAQQRAQEIQEEEYAIFFV